MIGKKFLAFSLSAVILAGSAMSASAAGVKDVFDANTYANKYSDVKAAFGTDATKLLEHFKAFGAKEGRVMSPILDVVAYRNAYADLNAAYGDNWDAYVDHYLTTGIKEKRASGVLFDLVDYANANPDVKAAFGEDYAAIAQHYINYGIKEGRPGGVIATASATTSSSSSSSNSGSTTQAPTKPTTPAQPTTPTQTTELTHVHAKGDPRGSAEATCTQEGYQDWLCDEPLYYNYYENGKFKETRPVMMNGVQVRCTVVWREDLPKAHVAPDDGNVYAIHPTCTTDGLTRYTCARCGEKIEQTYKAVGHSFTITAEKVSSKSCKPEDAGYEIKKCERCGALSGKTALAPLPHKMGGQPNLVSKSTCKEKGSAYGYCDWCATKVDVELPLADHTYKPATTHRTVYADSYLEGTEKGHLAYEISYCDYCKEITWVSEDITYAPCSDGDKSGACDACNLPNNRNVTSQVKIYVEGEMYIGDVQ